MTGKKKWLDMQLTILGSGGCMVIPKALCQCDVCREARTKGPPYERTGPSAFIPGENLLIDTPAEINSQLNRAAVRAIDYLIFTHLDPDHLEGFRIVEQATIDFRSWRAYPQKQIQLMLPQALMAKLNNVRTAYGSQLAYYEKQGFVACHPFDKRTRINELGITALPVDRGDQTAFVYVFEKDGRKLVYAPCDVKPFPEADDAVRGADLLVIQPGIFETGLKHGFVYPKDHVSRKTLYTFEETLALSRRIGSRKVLFVHLEEYWNRSYTDYIEIEKNHQGVAFAYDGMRVDV
jgi:phosphoribosyl 1,2-cyclic phosphate phosphodiesterase